MKKKFGKAAMFMAGALMLLAPAMAQAQESGPFYFTPKILYSRQNTDNFSGRESFRGWDLSSTNYSGGSKGEDSFGGGAAIGYDFGATSNVPVRAELEYLIRSRTDSDYASKRTGDDGTNLMDTAYQAQTNTQTVFANVYYDFKNDSAFTPYLGAGLGGAYVKGQMDSTFSGQNSIDLGPNYTNATRYPSGTISHKANGSHNSWNFAWNLSAGAAYQFTDSLALDLSYRYSDLGTIDYGTHGYYSTFNATNLAGDPVTVRAGGYDAKGEADLTSHEVILGLRFSAW